MEWNLDIVGFPNVIATEPNYLVFLYLTSAKTNKNILIMGVSFLPAGVACHVLASTLKILPGSLLKALNHRNPDKDFWMPPYKEEYDGLFNNNTFDLISEDEYFCLSKQHGV